MSNISNEVTKEIEKLEKLLERMTRFKMQEPKGSLKCHKKGTRTFFYQLFWNKQTGKCEEKYIKKANLPLIKALAQKHYYVELEPIVKKNLCALRAFEKKYDEEKAEEIFDDLCEVRKGLVIPAFVSKAEKVRRWFAEKTEVNASHPENLRFETDQGEMVRSKSEVIIANALYRHRDVIFYKYEKPLELAVGSKIIVFHPDFTILNVRTGRIMYWEHAGRIGDEEYTDDFVWRMNAYTRNGVFPRDMVVTFESDEKPLDMAVVKKIVADLCEG